MNSAAEDRKRLGERCANLAYRNDILAAENAKLRSEAEGAGSQRQYLSDRLAEASARESKLRAAVWAYRHATSEAPWRVNDASWDMVNRDIERDHDEAIRIATPKEPAP